MHALEDGSCCAANDLAGGADLTDHSEPAPDLSGVCPATPVATSGRVGPRSIGSMVMHPVSTAVAADKAEMGDLE